MATSHNDEATAPGETAALSRHPAAFAIGGGLAAAFGSSFIPMTAIEGFVTAYGIAELLPAAAPPLGDTARLALSAGIGTLTAGALLALLPRGEIDEMGFETTAKEADSPADEAETGDAATAKSGKLAGWLRTLRFGKSEAPAGTVTDFSDLNRLRIRNGDQHPDAPVRAPIRASSDLAELSLDVAPFGAKPATRLPLELGDDLAFTAPSARQDIAVATASLQLAPPSVALDAEPPESIEERPARMPAQANPVAGAEDAAPSPKVAADVTAPAIDETLADAQPVKTSQNDASADLESLSIADLLERLEAGLVRRRQIGLYPSQGGSVAPETTARLFALGKPSGLAGDASVDESLDRGEAASDARPIRFRLGQPAIAPTEAQANAIAARPDVEVPTRPTDAATDAVEYQAPIVGAPRPDMIEASHGAFSPSVEPALAEEPASSPAPAAQPIDDDMDAALRDALATLRNLSDRQRNA